MLNLQKLALDLDAVETGVWCKHPIGFEFRIRRTDYAPFAQAVLEGMREARAIHGEKVPEAASSQVMAEAVAAHLVTDWRGVTEDGPDGKPVAVPFDAKRLAELLHSPEMADLFAWTYQCAKSGELFRQSATKATLGKS